LSRTSATDAPTLYMWYINRCAIVSATINIYSTIHKNIKKIENLKNSQKKWRFCHARHKNVTHGSSEAYEFVTIKLHTFWHHSELCSRGEKSSHRDKRWTDGQTHTHTFFFCFIVFKNLKTSKKNIKSEGRIFFRANSILRYSNANRSKFKKLR
jgi:hypothetical protein